MIFYSFRNGIYIVILLATAPAFGQGPSKNLSDSSPLERRFEEEQFSRISSFDSSHPLFATKEEAQAAFERGGKWSLEFSSGGALDSNPFRRSDSQSDWLWEYGASLGYEWWVSESSGIVITPSVSAEGQRYDQFSELDGDMLGSGLTITFKNLIFSPTLEYAGAWGFESGYGENNYTEHVASLAIGKKYPLRSETPKPSGKNVVVTAPELSPPTFSWRLAGGYKFTDPSVLEQSFISGSLRLDVPVTKKLVLSAGAGLAYRSYTGFEPKDRETWVGSGSAALIYQIADSVDLSAAISYTHSDDKISTSDYDQVLTTISVSWTPDIKGFLGLPQAYAPKTAP
ncbi:MAG: DUF481 domain-containing protein [Proteobacteria bacterium]|nr:MAG: DUF481 domain-containing protein [Pseudomonadota bacterium]